MKFKLRNVGLIKAAEIKFDGLTVIAGKNDTGKTTLGKYLYGSVLNKSLGISLDESLLKTHSENAHSSLEYSENEEQIKQVIFIDSPIFLDMFSYLKNAALLFLQRKLSFNQIDAHRTDLVLLLSQVKDEDYQYKDLYHQIEQIIDGQMYYDKVQDDIFYQKNQNKLKDKRFQMKETANGIKMFGYLQILCLNKSIECMIILFIIVNIKLGKSASLPVTEDIAARLIRLPMFYALTETEQTFTLIIKLNNLFLILNIFYLK